MASLCSASSKYQVLKTPSVGKDESAQSSPRYETPRNLGIVQKLYSKVANWVRAERVRMSHQLRIARFKTE
jgi:hypothetical protein